MMELKVIEDLMDNRLSSWNDLLYKSSNPLPFQRIEWVTTWWQTFSTEDDKLLIILAKKEEELIGIAPLMYKKSSPQKYTRVKFIGTGFFDYFDFIIKEGREKEVILGFIDCICQRFSCFELQLNNILQTSYVMRTINKSNCLKKSKYIFHVTEIVPYIELPQTKQQLQSQIRKSLRLDLARKERRLSRVGQVEFRKCGQLNEAKDTLEDFFCLHIKKWESDSGYSVYKFAPRRNFLRALLDNVFEKNIVTIYYLTLNGEKIAVCFAFEIDRKFLYYSFAHEPAYNKCSPGKVLLGKLINYAIENNYREFDFGLGDEAYKLKWPCQIRKIFNIYIYTNKNSFLNAYLILRRHFINGYFLAVLPILRKFSFAVNLWRWFNRKRGGYSRFQ